METLKSPLFIICLLLFFIHQVLQKFFAINFNGIDSYLDNLLAMPIILSLLLAERRILFRRGRSYTLSALEIILATAYISLITEVVFPTISSKFTADWLDVLVYSAGSLVFSLTINHALPVVKQQKEDQATKIN